MTKKIIRLATDFRIEIVTGPETLNFVVIILETMAGGRLVLGPEELELLEANLPKIKAALKKMIGVKNW